ncbi:zinc finger matrin-type protein 4 isoform X2 [Pantherophis guttatus]|uniref:Zinc finger matrin-type protein 4 isoform X2 n=1 Tax=Pantherophis guttatus TaxID=94885 RepID=A0A6P9C629_PANGU|nr:zinc finger matrin-type protein 4 isoform X2 [Pantherophis guttatus]
MKSSEIDQELFTESYCRVCSAQLISESQRVAHYESRKHASKVRLYYMLHPIDGGCPAKKLRSENGNDDDESVDKNKCCTLCNMSFTSAVVAESHYQGKIHAKRLKLLLGVQPTLKATGLKRTYTCNICNVTLNSIEQYHAHLKGSKHQNNLKNQ